jgi:hypothetical protein
VENGLLWERVEFGPTLETDYRNPSKTKGVLEYDYNCAKEIVRSSWNQDIFWR